MKTRGVSILLINLILSVALAFSFVYTLASSLHLEYSAFSMILLISLVTIICSVACRNKLSVKIAVVAILILTAGSLFYILIKGLFDDISLLADKYLVWLNGYVAGDLKLVREYEFFTVLFMVIPISIVIYLTTMKKLSFFLPLFFGCSIFIIQWTLGYFNSYLSLYIFLAVILVYYFRHIYIKHSLNENNDYLSPSHFSLYAVPVSVIMVLVALVLPASDKPLEWPWLDEKINSVYNYLSDRFSTEYSDYFSISSSGFGSNNSKLGGKVRLDDTLVLEVKSSRRVYLKGNTRDIYTGTQWLDSNTNLSYLRTFNINSGIYGTSPIYNDLSELFMPYYFMQDGDYFPELNSTYDNYSDFPSLNEYVKEFFFTVKNIITYKDLRTKSLFTPLKTRNLDFSEKNEPDSIYHDMHGIFSLDKVQSKGFSYNADTFIPKYGNDEFKDLLRKSEIGFYDSYYKESVLNKVESLNTRIKTLFGDKLSVQLENGNSRGLNRDIVVLALNMNDNAEKANILNKLHGETALLEEFKELERAIERISRIFTQSFKTYVDSIYKTYLQLPESLSVRVRDLAQQIAEGKENNYDRVKAIETYLSTSYQYTLEPPSTPKERDFVDFFLFDSKEGYCTYYATAMTTMVRSLGIPARYVEGYVLPAEPEGRDTYMVTNKQAHAWVEVYFEGFGWVPFEPTAPFVSNFYSSTADTGSNLSGSFHDTPDYMDYMEDMMGQAGQNNDPFSNDFDFEDQNDQVDEKAIAAIAAAIMIIALLFVMAFNLLRRKIQLYSIFNMQPRESILAIYLYYMSVLKAQGYGIYAGETPSQYAQRIDKYFIFTKTRFTSITDRFIIARYSRQDIKESDKEAVLAFQKDLIDRTKWNMGKCKYFILKHILGKI